MAKGWAGAAEGGRGWFMAMVSCKKGVIPIERDHPCCETKLMVKYWIFKQINHYEWLIL